MEPAELAGLLARASSGDQSAWRGLVDLYARRVFAMAYSRLHNRDLAEEISQSVFSTVAVKLGTGDYSEQGKFESWLMRVTMNRIRDEARRVRRHATPTDPSLLLDSRNEIPAEPEDEGTFARLRDAMEQLPDADREILTLRHQGQMGFKEMSELLEEPVGTLLARHHRALKKLRELLTAKDESRDRS